MSTSQDRELRRPGLHEREILSLDEAAEFLGVSVKTFNKVLHQETIPARKIGREWKFSRAALVAWIGDGRSTDYYREGTHEARRRGADTASDARRTGGWQID